MVIWLPGQQECDTLSSVNVCNVSTKNQNCVGYIPDIYPGFLLPKCKGNGYLDHPNYEDASGDTLSCVCDSVRKTTLMACAFKKWQMIST